MAKTTVLVQSSSRRWELECACAIASLPFPFTSGGETKSQVMWAQEWIGSDIGAGDGLVHARFIYSQRQRTEMLGPRAMSAGAGEQYTEDFDFDFHFRVQQCTVLNFSRTGLQIFRGEIG